MSNTANTTRPALQDDLEYLRTLAEAGARAPILGGKYLAWFGGLVTLAYVAHYAMLNGMFGLSAKNIGFMWMGVMGVALLGFFVMLATERRNLPGKGSAGNRLQEVIWMYGGFSIFAFFVGSILGALFVPGGAAISPDASLPLVFAVYALGLLCTGDLGGQTVMRVAGWAALAMVGVTTALQGLDLLYLAGAVGVFLTVFLTGVVLMLTQPRLTV